MRAFSVLVSAALALCVGAKALAHEFWISPETYRIGAEDQLRADLRLGQMFEGAAFSYLPPQFERFHLVYDGRVVPVEGRIGDLPALAMPAPGPGLVTVVHQTTDSVLTYTEAERFADFATHKGFPDVLDAHKARGLPETGFRERYSRYAKSLIAVDGGVGRDGPVGMLTEIVALANPYTDDLSGGMPVRVLYQGAARIDAQVEVFAKAPDGAVTVATYRTDGKGEATIPVARGMEYLIDAVVMRPLTSESESDPVWESLWASLTFRVPG